MKKKSIAFGFNGREFAADLSGGESAAPIFPKPCWSRI